MISGSVTWFLSYNKGATSERELLFPLLQDYLICEENAKVLRVLICVIVFLKFAEFSL